MSMLDGKMVTRLLQLGGAYCTMCTNSSEECHDENTISEGFQITRTTQSLRDLALSLEDPETGEISRSRNDYSIRSGTTATPITVANVTEHIPVCHAKIRTFEWFVDLIVRLNSHQKWSSVQQRQTYTQEEKESYKSERQKLKENFYDHLAINIGDPSDMVTGTSFKKFCTDFARNILVNFIKDKSKQDSFKKIHLQLCAVVLLLNSQKRKIQLDVFRALCTDTYLEIRKSFPWAIISPSIHRILGHSWERIEMNQYFGLGNESEEGLEALNKMIRYYRARGSRTISTEANFTDTFNHLWRLTSPLIAEMEREKRRRTPKLKVMQEIEALVESLFSEEESN
jgi:hypothetical protein